MDTDKSGCLSLKEFVQFWEGLRPALKDRKV